MKRVAVGLAALAILAGCQAEREQAPVGGGGKSASLRVMEQVATAAYKCWFASKDPAFRQYAFANELNSMSGQPRFLLVPKKNFGGRPLLVVQARGLSSRVEAFGPLLDEPLGSRVRADVLRWSRGDAGCGAAA
jgi:hypothetical protein